MSVVLSLYDESGVMVRPWLDAGYRAVIVDRAHPAGETTEGGLTRTGADMVDWVPPRWLAREEVAAVFAFPPCDHLAVSGARWFREKGLSAFSEAVTLFGRAIYWCEWFGAPFAIENPVSTISSYWREPDYTFHPADFAFFEPAETYLKRTCLWTGNGFRMPEARPVAGAVPDTRIHRAPPGPDRKRFRSRTPAGFARAVFAANSDVMRVEND